MTMNEFIGQKCSYWFCKQCNRNLGHGEFYFTCVVCDEYDLCERCLTTLNPLHPHRMVCELAYGKEEFAGERCNASMADGIETTVTMYHNRFCLGVREIEKANHSQYADSYSWLTFETVGIRSRNFGRGLRELIAPRDYLGICSGNRPEWVITDFACIFQGITSVTMYCLFNESELTYIINHTNLSVVVCDRLMLLKLIPLSVHCPSLRHLICMDSITKDITINDQCIGLHYMGDIEKRGATKQFEQIHVDLEQCLTVVYTSGSAGFPKGAMISHQAYQTTFLKRYSPFRLDPIYFCYEPLAWITGRSAVFKTFFAGGRTGFSTGQVSLLMEDLALVRPTSFSATPAIWNKIYAEYQAALSLAPASGENRLLKEFSQLIPRRCKRINVGGAMISPAVLDFIKRCFSHCCVYESYGITECGAVASNNTMRNTLQFRLLSVPEMGYTTEDEPFPRGELLIKSDEMFSGYINNPTETEAALTHDGFFRSGDIVELRVRPNGEYDVNVLDRKKNFFKLSQGQFISPEYLQSIYIQSPFVEQIYVHGDPLADSISAVLVPNRDYAHAFASSRQWTTLDENNPRQEFHDAVSENLPSMAQQHSLRVHEIPSRIIIDFQPFTPENGLMTDTMKPCRRKLAAYYGDRLKQSHTIEERLRTLIETVTNQSCINDEKRNVLIPTGGDSLTAIRLSHIIEHDFGISLPISLLLESNTTVRQLAAAIEDPAITSSIPRAKVEQLLHDSEFPFDMTVRQCKSTSASPSMIFLTGVTGFVGAFLLTELLLTYPWPCQLVCLVRCQSSVNPIDRIRENLLFHQLWKEDFRERILPLQGDLEKPFFGLDHEAYESLAKQIDLIFHCGSAVNFVFPYSKLYRTNVYGTQEIVRLATSTTISIPIHYISTVSILTSDVNSDVTVDEISPEHLVNGYAQSKWVAEKLLVKARSLGVPVTIYRLGSTWASTDTGACNRADLQTLLFVAMVKSNSYPQTLTHTRLNGLPVDLTAKSIVYLSRNQSTGERKTIYHVQNPNSEVLFEDVIDSMRWCGVSLTSVSTEEWRKKLKKINDGNSSIASLNEFLNANLFRENQKGSREQFCHSTTALMISPLDDVYLIKWFTFILDNVVSLY